jgi:hypothetical protein
MTLDNILFSVEQIEKNILAIKCKLVELQKYQEIAQELYVAEMFAANLKQDLIQECKAELPMLADEFYIEEPYELT